MLEWQYSSTVTFYGNIVAKHDTFDHAFGTQKVTDYEVEGFEVWVSFGTMLEQVKLCDKSMLLYYRDEFLQWALKQEIAS